MWVNIVWVTFRLYLIDRVHRYRVRLVLYYRLWCANIKPAAHHQRFCYTSPQRKHVQCDVLSRPPYENLQKPRLLACDLTCGFLCLGGANRGGRDLRLHC
jgi:hypothetical protein